MSFSVRKFQDQSEAAFLKKVVVRTLSIFFIGLLLNAFPFVRYNEAGTLILKDLSAVRVMGVLQRIALCYGIASIALRYLTTRGTIAFSALLLIGYWVIMYYFGDAADRYSLNGNAALRLDMFLIGPENMYKGEGVPFDPEGILSTFPAVVNVIAGFLVGQYIQKFGNTRYTVIRLAIGGVASLLWHFAGTSYFQSTKKYGPVLTCCTPSDLA